MFQGKFLIVLVLLVAPFLAISQTVGGQADVTQTATTMVTNSQTSTVTMEGSVVTSNSSQMHPIISSSLTLPPTHGVCGTYFVQPFNGTSGAEFSGNLISDNKVDFYVMTDAAFQAWSHQVVAGGNCTPASLVLSQKGTTDYNFTIQIPSDGLYQIVVNNLSASTVTAHLSANLTTSTPVTLTMVTYSTSTQANVQTLTLITMGQSTSQGSDNSTLIFGALAIVIIIVVALVARAKRAKAGSK
jgi:heme/copper-type cytochrome/quinol oxidase subunit 4